MPPHRHLLRWSGSTARTPFLQALHTFLTAHQGTEWAVAAVDIQHFKLYNELYGTEKGDVLLETMANCLLGYSKQTGYPVGYFGNDDFFLCLPDEKAEQTAVLATLQACMAAGRQDVTFFVVMGVCPCRQTPVRMPPPCATMPRSPV